MPDTRPGLANVLRDAIRDFSRDDCFPLAGNIAFSTLLAAFPFLIFTTTLAGFLGDEQLARTAVDYLFSVAPEDQIAPLAREVEKLLTQERGGILTISVLVTVWTASGGVRSVRIGLNRAYNTPETRPFFTLVLWDIAFVFIGTFVLLMLSLLIVVAPVAIGFAGRYVPAIDAVSGLFLVLRIPIVAVLATAALLAVHRFLPNRPHTMREVFPGVALTIGLWLAVSIGFSEYLRNFANYAGTYAGLAGAIAALMFLYLSAAVVLFGAQFNQKLIDRARTAPPPAP